MWIVLGYNMVKCDCELYRRFVNLFPLAKLPSHLKVFQLADEEVGTPRGTVLMCMYTYIPIYRPSVPQDFQMCCSNGQRQNVLQMIHDSAFLVGQCQTFWKARLFFSFACLFLMVDAWSVLERGHFRRVHALDLERGNNSNACNSVLSGSVWGQIYWADLVFQYIVAAGHRSSTPDF